MTGADAGDPGRPQLGRVRTRYVRRVGPQHVGSRVSVRHLTTDPDRGPVPTDVVGRLLAYDDDAMLVVDRAGRLHALDPAQVIASRIVPPHPRHPPEPEVGTREQPLVRSAARVVLVDAAERVLLVAHAPSGRERVWTAPGGGLDPGETHEQAATRELREELGVDVTPGPWIWRRRVTFPFHGVWLDQDERWFVARAELDAASAPLEDVGTVSARWWSLGDLRATGETLAPAALPVHLQRLLTHGPPERPVDVGR